MYKISFKKQFLIGSLIVYFFSLLWLNTQFPTLYVDEGFQLQLSQKPVLEIISRLTKDTHPPLYSIILYFWMKAFGSSLFTARLLSMFFQVGAVFYFYKLLRLHLDGLRSYIGSILYATMPIIFTYNIVARNYSILQFILISGLYFVFKNWQKTNDKKHLKILTLILISALYTHILAIPFVASFYLFLIISKTKKQKIAHYFKALGYSLITFLPWLYFTYKNLVDPTRGSSWLRFNPLTQFQDIAFTLYPIFTKPTKYFVFAIVVLLYLSLTQVWRKKISPYAKTIALILIFLFTALYILSFISPIFYYRYLMITIPLTVYLFSHIVSKKTELAIAIGTSVLIFNLFTHNHLYKNIQKTEFVNIERGLVSQDKNNLIVIDESLYYFQLKQLGYTNVHLFDPDKKTPYWYGSALLENSDYLTARDLNQPKLQYINKANRDFATYFARHGYIESEKLAEPPYTVHVFIKQ
jgi:uncharacterized membrane protein